MGYTWDVDLLYNSRTTQTIMLKLRPISELLEVKDLLFVAFTYVEMTHFKTWIRILQTNYFKTAF